MFFMSSRLKWLATWAGAVDEGGGLEEEDEDGGAASGTDDGGYAFEGASDVITVGNLCEGSYVGGYLGAALGEYMEEA